MTSFPDRVFSGIQPTGNLHLGNYLGAIVKFVALQKTHECLFCVVDLHAITVPQTREELLRAIRKIAAAYVASGVDPVKNIISIKVRSPNTRSWPGFSTVSPASAGSTA